MKTRGESYFKTQEEQEKFISSHCASTGTHSTKELQEFFERYPGEPHHEYMEYGSVVDSAILWELAREYFTKESHATLERYLGICVEYIEELSDNAYAYSDEEVVSLEELKQVLSCNNKETKGESMDMKCEDFKPGTYYRYAGALLTSTWFCVNHDPYKLLIQIHSDGTPCNNIIKVTDSSLGLLPAKCWKGECDKHGVLLVPEPEVGYLYCSPVADKVYQLQELKNPEDNSLLYVACSRNSVWIEPKKTKEEAVNGLTFKSRE
jgi:hypothetical protein